MKVWNCMKMMLRILESMEWNQSMVNAIDVAYPRKLDKDSKSWWPSIAAATLQAHQHHHHHPRQRTCVSSRGGWVMDWAYRTLTVTMANPFFYGALSLSNWCSSRLFTDRFQASACYSRVSNNRFSTKWVIPFAFTALKLISKTSNWCTRVRLLLAKKLGALLRVRL